MGTLSTAWNIATGALQADQAALNIVANNTANANTTGYTREIAKWQETDPVQVNVSTRGTGVQMVGAESQRDRILEQNLQQQSQQAAAGEARLDALNSVQTVFSDSGSSTSTGGIAAAISDYFNSMAQLGELSQQHLASTAGVECSRHPGTILARRGEKPWR